MESEQVEVSYKPNNYNLPVGWELKQLKEILISAKLGSNYENAEGNFGMPLIKMGNLLRGHISLAGLKFVPLELNHSKDEFLQQGDLLLNTRNTLDLVGKVAVWRKELPQAVFDSNILRLKFSDEYVYSTYFMNYLFNGYEGLKQLRKFAIGTTSVAAIYSRDLMLFKALLPPLNQQRKIVIILSTWDEAIQTARLLLKAKQERRRGLMQKLLTGQKRLPGFSEKWREVYFSDMLREIKRPVKWNDDEVYDLLSVRRRSGGVFFRESLSGREILTQNLRTAKAGEFLISKMQIVHGASGLVREEHDGMKISGSYIAVVSRDSDLLDIEFFDWYSQLKSFYRLCYTSSYGVHIEKMTFDFADFLKRKISIPPTIAEQRTITAVLNAMNEEIRLATAEVQALQQQKRGLMQQLLTGNKLVTVDE